MTHGTYAQLVLQVGDPPLEGRIYFRHDEAGQGGIAFETARRLLTEDLEDIDRARIQRLRETSDLTRFVYYPTTGSPDIFQVFVEATSEGRTALVFACVLTPWARVRADLDGGASFVTEALSMQIVRPYETPEMALFRWRERLFSKMDGHLVLMDGPPKGSPDELILEGG